MMRGGDAQTEKLFCYVSPDSYVPKDHPLRPVKKMVDRALRELYPEFTKMYSHTGRPSIAPEKLLRALLLQALYSIRSVRLLMEQIGYSILFRWFLGLSLDDPVWEHSTFSQNQQRLLASEVAAKFFAKIKEQAEKANLLSDEHFSVDGTLIEAWASIKSFQPKDEPPRAPGGRNEEVDFRGQRLTHQTHASSTDPDARLFKKSKGAQAKLSYLGNVLMENRNGLIVDVHLTRATGTGEREAAIAMLERIPGDHRLTLGADKNYDTREFVATTRLYNITPHVAQNKTRKRSALDGRTTRHKGYDLSQRARKRVEETFGWIKTVGAFRKTRYVGTEKVSWFFTLTAAAYNLIRMRNLALCAP
jgi:transposase